MSEITTLRNYAFRPQHCLNFFPLPHEHGSFLPIFGADLVTGKVI